MSAQAFSGKLPRHSFGSFLLEFQQGFSRPGGRPVQLGDATRKPPPQNPHREFTVVRESKVTVKIPRPIYRKIQQVVEGSGFNSPTDFIVYVLRDLMGEADKETHDFTQEELDEVKRKLENLGYL